MYIHPANLETDSEKLVDFMQTHPFATLITQQGGLHAVHIPIVTEFNGKTVTLSSHVAKANPQWRAFGGEALLMFGGPHAYISPTLYQKEESVPTWVYVAVHAYGVPEAVHFDEEPERALALMDKLIRQSEPSYAAQWAGLSETYRVKMMRAVVSFELRVERLEGSYKLDQHKSKADKENVTKALLEHPATTEVGGMMLEQLRKT